MENQNQKNNNKKPPLPSFTTILQIEVLAGFHIYEAMSFVRIAEFLCLYPFLSMKV